MRTYVLDTSVAVAWYLPERFAGAARKWQRQLLENRVRLLVPALHFWEIGNVLRTYVCRAELESALAQEVYALHLDAPLEVVEPERGDVLATALDAPLEVVTCWRRSRHDVRRGIHRARAAAWRPAPHRRAEDDPVGRAAGATDRTGTRAGLRTPLHDRAP